MSARRRLNSANLFGAALVAGLVGLATGSTAAFLVVLAVLLAGALHAGDIRLSGRR